MNQNRYVLALDVGERRIGVALASLIARIAAPLMHIDRTKTDDVITEINALVVQHDVSTIVVGLPRGMKGEDTAQTDYARDFAKELEKFVEVPVVLQDEAVTSLEAERRLKERGKPYVKGDIDAEAAALILHDYLQTMVERTA